MFRPYLDFWFDCGLFKIHTRLASKARGQDIVDHIFLKIEVFKWKHFEFRLYTPGIQLAMNETNEFLKDKVKTLKRELDEKKKEIEVGNKILCNNIKDAVDKQVSLYLKDG